MGTTAWMGWGGGTVTTGLIPSLCAGGRAVAGCGHFAMSLDGHRVQVPLCGAGAPRTVSNTPEPPPGPVPVQACSAPQLLAMALGNCRCLFPVFAFPRNRIKKTVNKSTLKEFYLAASCHCAAIQSYSPALPPLPTRTWPPPPSSPQDFAIHDLKMRQKSTNRRLCYLPGPSAPCPRCAGLVAAGTVVVLVPALAPQSCTAGVRPAGGRQCSLLRSPQYTHP